MTEKKRLIETYVDELVKELEGCDPALIMDAANDAHEFLHSETENLMESNPELDLSAAVAQAIETFGAPSEVAQAFLDVDGHVSRALSWPKPQPKKKAIFSRIGALFTDQRAYLSLLYLVLSGITGLAYFMWTTYGLIITVASCLFIIGIPISLLFFGSVRAVTLAESRMIEALLGERMPRRPIFHRVQGNILSKFWVTIKDIETWTSLLYMLLMFPLGMSYCLGVILIFGTAVEFFVVPFFPHPTEIALFFFNALQIDPQPWHIVFTLPIGLMFLVAPLGVTSKVGRFHAKLAKFLLVTRSARSAAKKA